MPTRLSTRSNRALNPPDLISVPAFTSRAPGRRAAQLIVRMAEQTPPTRDRYVDFLRAVAILAVVCGHWTIATIQRTPHGIVIGNVLSHQSGLRPLTWAFQVMGVFFVVGGFSTRRTIEAVPDFDAGAFFASRVERLLRPTLVFVAVWISAVVVLRSAGVDARLTHAIARIAAQPLWFLAVYLIVTLIAPAQLALHRRAPALLVVLLPIATVAADVLRFDHSAPGVAVLNYLFVFAFAQELGFHLSSGWDRVARVAAVLVATGAAATLLALVIFGPYPVSMVGLPGARVSNMSPPTVCILLLTVMQTAIFTVLRPAGQRWLAGRRPWIATVGANAGIMTIFLWHLSAAAVVGALLYAADVLPAPGSRDWWLLKIPWFVGCLALLAGFVLALVAVERLPAWTGAQRGRVVLRSIGVVLAVRGFAGFALTGFDHLFTAGGSAFLGTRLSPFVDALLLLGGYVCACGIPAHRRDGSKATARVSEVPTR